MGVEYVRLQQEEIDDLLLAHDAVPQSQRDAMAIPTYSHANPLIRWLFHRRHETIAGMIDVPDGGSVLEFGCGIGAFLPTLAARFHVFAIDLEPCYAQELSARRGMHVDFVSDLGELPDSSLDAIVAADVLEHVDDLPELIGVMRAKLRPAGLLIVSGPTENLIYRIGRLVAGFSEKGGYHHRDAIDVEECIRESGMIRSRVAFLPWRLPPHLFRIALFRNGEGASFTPIDAARSEA